MPGKCRSARNGRDWSPGLCPGGGRAGHAYPMHALRMEGAHGLTFMLRRRERYMASLLVAHWNFCASNDALYSVRLGACVSADAVKTSTSACARGCSDTAVHEPKDIVVGRRRDAPRNTATTPETPTLLHTIPSPFNRTRRWQGPPRPQSPHAMRPCICVCVLRACCRTHAPDSEVRPHCTALRQSGSISRGDFTGFAMRGKPNGVC